MPDRPKPPANSYWQPISTAGFVALLLGCGWLFMLLATDEDGFLQILDSFNLVIHEFGHPFFGILGETPMWWGGTLMQLIVPAGIAFVFWYQRSALSFALAGVWFFENFLNIGRYVGDARAQELPLVGGGEHDWTTILADMGRLHQDQQIAATLNLIGWVGMVACVGFAVFAWISQRGGAPEPIETTRVPMTDLRRS